MRAGVAYGGLVSPVLFNLYVNDIPTPSRHVELTQNVDDTPLGPTPRSPSLLIGYLEIYLAAVLFVKAARRIKNPRAVQLLREPTQWVKTARYLRATLDIQLTWSAQVNQVGKKAAQKSGVLGPLLNTTNGLFIRNGVLVYKQLIHSMMDYTCPIWKSAARSHVRNLQVSQTKCFGIATNSP
jgi:hypothetical protein